LENAKKFQKAAEIADEHSLEDDDDEVPASPDDN